MKNTALKIIPTEEPAKRPSFAIDEGENKYRYKAPFFADASKHPEIISPVKARLNELKKGKKLVENKSWWRKLLK